MRAVRFLQGGKCTDRRKEKKGQKYQAALPSAPQAAEWLKQNAYHNSQLPSRGSCTTCLPSSQEKPLSVPKTTNLSEINPDEEACVAVEKRNPKCLQLICHIRVGSFEAGMVGPQVHLVDPV